MASDSNPNYIIRIVEYEDIVRPNRPRLSQRCLATIWSAISRYDIKSLVSLGQGFLCAYKYSVTTFKFSPLILNNRTLVRILAHIQGLCNPG